MNGLQLILVDERPRLLRFLAARGAGEDAEDLLHDLWQKLAVEPARPVADPRSYVFRAAENLVRDARRSSVSRGKRQYDWMEVADGPSDQPGGDRVLIAREQLEAVQAALTALGPRVEHAFRRFRLEGVGQAQIAAELGISLSSVEKDLHKAYHMLADIRTIANTG
ncbi:MAG: sigma-70 family RNA polymerase sigma factor [Sphingopyxis sp.]|uniref:RNA polymerase sigma factor n=1 Tax=Sphingopyxis sp. TaxID=1908224 RepID=UPI002ABC445D|nr:sigma-70 family RNA polymerase sigma factor [Sphingopyxis sp.]MDZ3833297.1 sigma-70 family RNA polymerase sigma factor [Sphingopyxis sp.]